MRAAAPKPGAYAFQPPSAGLPYAVQLRLTPELKELLLQAHATGGAERVSLRVRERDVSAACHAHAGSSRPALQLPSRTGRALPGLCGTAGLA